MDEDEVGRAMKLKWYEYIWAIPLLIFAIARILVTNNSVGWRKRR